MSSRIHTTRILSLSAVTGVVLVALGAALGAPARYLTDRLIQARHESPFPWGTLTVNVAGSFQLGLLAGLPVSEPVMVAIGVSFCGALTTYSTFGYETVRVAQAQARFYAAVILRTTWRSCDDQSESLREPAMNPQREFLRRGGQHG